MIKLIYTALTHSRTVLMLSALIVISGLVSYISIPRESFPNVSIPFVNIYIFHEGISPEDADRLLVAPIYKQIKSLEGVKEITSVGASSHASITIEFEQNTDIDAAMNDIREKLDLAKPDLPADSEEPQANEYNIALRPIISLALAGDNIDERTMLSIANKTKDELESISGVLEAKVQGKRDEVVEILVNPHKLQSYNINQSDLMRLVSRNNRLVAAGTLNTQHGLFAVKVPGLFESVDDIMNLPVKQTDNFVVTLKDIATISRTFDDPDSIVRLNGKPMLSIDVSKRVGANIIDITDQIKLGVQQFKKLWPKNLQALYLQDESLRVRNYLSDLENSVIFSTLLVMIVIIAALGVNSGWLIGTSIPSSFLTGILFLSIFGMTLNIVVLFSLILSVGMLVDASIVVIEYADRRIAEGASKRNAYAEASIRMAWPIASSTATTLAVFAPLLFWPGMMGQFMQYLPITLIFTLSASFVMAMILIPTLGSLRDKSELTFKPEDILNTDAEENLAHQKLDRLSLWYLEKLKIAVKHPKRVLFLAIGFTVFSFGFYSVFGNGTTFFPDSDPEFATVFIKARGEMSLQEKDAIAKEVEKRIFGTKGIDKYYTTVYDHPPGQAAADTIAVIRLELSDWKTRPKAKDIFPILREKVKDVAGVIIEVRAEKRGPASGRDIELVLSALDYRQLLASVDTALKVLRNTPGLVDVEDSRPPPGYEWQLKVDREKASQFGVDLSDVGDTIRLVTNGVKLGEYRPNDAEDEVDIKIRYPVNNRNLDQLEKLRITTGKELIPISSFVKQKPAPKLASVNRIDGKYALKVEADVADGYLANDLIKVLSPELKKELGEDTTFQFKGKNEDQAETMAFLLKAFGVALFAMAIILVTQFNSFYQAFLILTAVIFSVNGVLYGLLLRGDPFSIVMSGVGIISLAGIVVNNNIVLIDTFNILKQQGLDTVNAALQTGAQRLRPILLTTVTTILGLLPMVFQINIKLLTHEIDFGAPSGQTWAQLSTAIAAGLTLATPITLFLTPCLLILGDKSIRQQTNESSAV